MVLFYCQTLLLLVLPCQVLATPIAAAAASVQTIQVIDAQYVLKGFEGCTDKDALKQGFSDAIKMIDSNIDWNSAPAQDFFGGYERNQYTRDRIQKNLNGAATVRYNYWFNPLVPRLHVRCDDPLKKCHETCPDGRRLDAMAYTIDNEPHVNFCVDYFVERQMDEVLKNPQDGRVQDLYAYYSQAAVVWAHEIMHFKDIAKAASPGRLAVDDVKVRGWPGYPDGRATAYGTEFTKFIAQNPTGSMFDSVDNAENYAMYFLGIYVMKKKGFYPHLRVAEIMPTRLPGTALAQAMNDTSTEMDRKGPAIPDIAMQDYIPGRRRSCY